MLSFLEPFWRKRFEGDLANNLDKVLLLSPYNSFKIGFGFKIEFRNLGLIFYLIEITEKYWAQLVVKSEKQIPNKSYFIWKRSFERSSGGVRCSHIIFNRLFTLIKKV